MKKLLLSALLFAALFVISEKSTQSQALYFYVTNNTGVTLVDVFVTPAETNNWGNDILPQSLFENGTSIKVDIPATYGETCKFDMKITDLNGAYITFKGMDACLLHTLTINGDGTYSATQ